ncbi:MAG: hypothetical protein AAFY65_04175 [Pseudomonadota bacterium]
MDPDFGDVGAGAADDFGAGPFNGGQAPWGRPSTPTHPAATERGARVAADFAAVAAGRRCAPRTGQGSVMRDGSARDAKPMPPRGRVVQPFPPATGGARRGPALADGMPDRVGT